MKDEGRVCDLKRQLMTTVTPLRWVSAVSVALVGADAQPVAATDSKMAMSTATRFVTMGTATRFTAMSAATRFTAMNAATRFTAMGGATRFVAMGTATRFMVGSLATTRLTFLDEVRRSWLR